MLFKADFCFVFLQQLFLCVIFSYSINKRHKVQLNILLLILLKLFSSRTIGYFEANVDFCLQQTWDIATMPNVILSLGPSQIQYLAISWK